MRTARNSPVLRSSYTVLLDTERILATVLMSNITGTLASIRGIGVYSFLCDLRTSMVAKQNIKYSLNSVHLNF